MVPTNTSGLRLEAPRGGVSVSSDWAFRDVSANINTKEPHWPHSVHYKKVEVRNDIKSAKGRDTAITHCAIKLCLHTYTRRTTTDVRWVFLYSRYGKFEIGCFSFSRKESC